MDVPTNTFFSGKVLEESSKEEQLKLLKKDLKDWEKKFQDKNGRKPNKDDIKANNMGKWSAINYLC
jgi:hypothetical protein